MTKAHAPHAEVRYFLHADPRHAVIPFDPPIGEIESFAAQGFEVQTGRFDEKLFVLVALASPMGALARALHVGLTAEHARSTAAGLIAAANAIDRGAGVS